MPSPPKPKPASSGLTRPDWVSGRPREAGKLWLDKNENTDPELARLVGRIVAEIPPEAVFSYPEAGPLYRKLAASLGIAPEMLVLGTGSDGCIRAVFEAFISPGDIVLRTDPTFAMYAVYGAMYGADTRLLTYRASPGGPVLDTETVLKAIRDAGPKLVCLPNPDSPTGTVFAGEALTAILTAAQKAGALILIDEAYYPFYPETVLPRIAEFPNLIVTRSTGKAWGMAGLRIGFMAADAEISKHLHKVAPMYDAATISIAVFERLLDFEADMLASVARLSAGKAHFLAAMDGLGFRTLDNHGNFLHVAFGGRAPDIHEALADLVYYRRDFEHDCLTGFSRFSATTTSGFQPVIARIGAIAKGTGP